MESSGPKQRLKSLLYLAEQGPLSGEDVLELSMVLDDCAVVAVRLLRAHCRHCAPERLRLRILSTLPHRTD
jgi:hypothetical protein